MLFNSFRFIFVFFPIVLLIARRLRGQRLLAWIALSSVIFYALFGQPWFIIPMLITTFLDFFLAPVIGDRARPRLRKLALGISLCGNLGLLVYFKYGMFFLQDIFPVIGALLPAHASAPMYGALKIILPAGISFYTFQTLAYVIDVYRGESPVERNFWKFTSFVAFFPHLIAGPLTRHNQLLPRLQRIKEEGITPLWRAGLYLFVIGLSKKLIIADRIADTIDPLLTNPWALGFGKAWLTLLGYSLQIYFDFSGYTDMAIGLGRVFGVELPQNFLSPYQAVDPSDFWRRWHITLSLWMRDYLYIPLGGNRRLPLRNLVVTMALGGLWHGAKWTFVVWGLYHGALLILYHALKPRWDGWPAIFRLFLTFVLISLGWVLFRSDSLFSAAAWFSGLAGFHGMDVEFAPRLLRVGACELATLWCVWKFLPASLFRGFEHLPRTQQIGLGFLFAVDLLMLNKPSPFMYFRF